ncbi:MAG: Sua5/YciO/YrdC/YwlC family protein [Candidatus Moranbacteria bacterium GW2011_GWF2_36_839]|nr:MAG: Sua5/YciO/YrdC/YwlC family protein [Candidatus Moranbacteria bacterium GW2011_GWF1_36_78]KKQ17096.1 MAG: Sua5/YciO/YrdC/YwlC family protein [Candidatus Moranbacteria bacterium GW2011_GWF2_36_839]HAT73700.1 threonylcarbamoyl-AMP synthase [Candidatus Moranbacteria bacterium]HBY11325.1 threonylcarbamoyl-AMP synthase [Candidatus Moranbacteria bacterium]
MIIRKSILADKLKKGEVAVIPTDTIYGLSTNAFSKDSIENIYNIKSRAPEKPMIILISKITDLDLFKIEIDNNTKKILKKVWPGKVSVILPCPNKKFHYLHRGTGSLAFRLPVKTNLIRLLKITGPLVSTSANPEGLPPAKTITQAKKYFDNSVDFYINEGPLESAPSTLIKIEDGKINILR